MSKVKQNLGVHTYAVGMTLTAAQSYEIKMTVWEISCVRAMETTGAGRSITPWTLFANRACGCTSRGWIPSIA